MRASPRSLRNKVVLGICAAGALTLASPLIARDDLASRYTHWEMRLRERVNDLLVYPMGATTRSGDVLVAFRIGQDGKPANVALAKPSGEALFDQAALRLVSHLGRIGQVPSAYGRVDRVVLKLSYGDPSLTAAASIRLAKRDAEERLANEQRNRALVSLAEVTDRQ